MKIGVLVVLAVLCASCAPKQEPKVEGNAEPRVAANVEPGQVAQGLPNEQKSPPTETQEQPKSPPTTENTRNGNGSTYSTKGKVWTGDLEVIDEKAAASPDFELMVEFKAHVERLLAKWKPKPGEDPKDAMIQAGIGDPEFDDYSERTGKKVAWLSRGTRGKWAHSQDGLSSITLNGRETWLLDASLRRVYENKD